MSECKHGNIYCEDCGVNFNDKFEAVERKIKTREKTIALKNSMLSKAYQDNDDLRRQVETLNNAKELSWYVKYQRAAQELPVLQRECGNLQSANAALCGALDDAITKIGLTANELNFIVKNFDSYDVKGYLEAMASDLNDRASGLTQALTASVGNHSKGVYLIGQERQRQIEKEGWTAEHDSQHKNGELAVAAIAYLMPEKLREPIADIWPWDVKYFKPTPNDRERELVKAGALIAAEIDRLAALGEEK